MTAPYTALIPHVPGWIELLVIVFVGLLVFGKRLPDVGRSLGRSIVEFKRGVREIQQETDEAAKPPPEEKALPPVDRT